MVKNHFLCVTAVGLWVMPVPMDIIHTQLSRAQRLHGCWRIAWYWGAILKSRIGIRMVMPRLLCSLWSCSSLPNKYGNIIYKWTSILMLLYSQTDDASKYIPPLGWTLIECPVWELWFLNINEFVWKELLPWDLKLHYLNLCEFLRVYGGDCSSHVYWSTFNVYYNNGPMLEMAEQNLAEIQTNFPL